MENAEKKDFWQDAQGRLVPDSLVRPIDKLEDKLVKEKIEEIKEAKKTIDAVNEKLVGDIDTFAELSAEQYGLKRGGKKGNIQLRSYDGKYKICIEIAEKIELGKEIEIAKELINECIADWSQDGRDEIKLLVQDAFSTDGGHYNLVKILSLRKFNFDDSRWANAIKALNDSIVSSATKRFLRVYERDESGKYQPLYSGDVRI